VPKLRNKTTDAYAVKMLIESETVIKLGYNPEAAFLVCLRYDAGTILETMPKVGDDHRTAFSEKQ
jgi:hypothetical protein